MGMTSHVTGYGPTDEKWGKMANAYHACRTAGVDPPDEIYDFFYGSPPTDLPGKKIDISGAVQAFQGEDEDGFDVDLEKLPKEVGVIRFCNSY